MSTDRNGDRHDVIGRYAERNRPTAGVTLAGAEEMVRNCPDCRSRMLPLTSSPETFGCRRCRHQQGSRFDATYVGGESPARWGDGSDFSSWRSGRRPQATFLGSQDEPDDDDLDDLEDLEAEDDRFLDELDFDPDSHGRYAGEPCETCGRAMYRFNGQGFECEFCDDDTDGF